MYYNIKKEKGGMAMKDGAAPAAFIILRDPVAPADGHDAIVF